jgi:hypothetical protein
MIFLPGLNKVNWGPLFLPLIHALVARAYMALRACFIN